MEQLGLWRSALATALSNHDDLNVVAQTPRLSIAMAIARNVQPDVLIVDISELAGNGYLTAPDEVPRVFPHCAIVVLVDPVASGVIGPLIPHAHGLFGKDGALDQLAEYVRKAAEGERMIDPDLAVAALQARANPLTKREMDILRLVRTGASQGDIAATLHLTPGTVRNYCSGILRKIDAQNKVEAVRIAEKAGWIF